MKKRTILLPAVLFFAAAFVVGYFLDLDISKAIFWKNNAFSLFMASLGEAPMYGGFGFAGAVIFGYLYRKEVKGWVRFLSVLLLLVCFGFGYYLSAKAFVSINAWGAISDVMLDNLLIGGIVCLFTMAPFWILGFLIGKKSGEKRNTDAFRAAVAFGLAALLQIALITVMKGIFHRPRFRFLEASDQFELFKPVFVRFKDYASYITEVFTKEEFKSFPSGHTGSGAMLIPFLTYLPYFQKKKDLKKQPFLLLIGVAYTILLAFSRMLVGAHFLTDVAFGALVTIFSFLVLDLIVFNDRMNAFFVMMLAKGGFVERNGIGFKEGMKEIKKEFRK